MTGNFTRTPNIDLRLSPQSRQDIENFRKELEATANTVASLKQDLKGITDLTKALRTRQIFSTSGGIAAYNEGSRFQQAQQVEAVTRLGRQEAQILETRRKQLSLFQQAFQLRQKEQALVLANTLKLGTQEKTLRKITDINQLNTRIEATRVRIGMEYEAGNQKGVRSLERQLQILREQVAEQQKLAKEAQRMADRPNRLAQQRRDNVERMFGDGGAGLFQIQAGLLGNYLIMNQLQTGFMNAVRFSADFDNSLRNLQAITATTDTGMVKLKDSLIQVSEQTKFTALEVTDAAVTLAQAGLTIEQVQESIGAVSLLATATGTDLAKAVDIATSTLGVFNMDASRMADVANILTEAVNKSKLDIEKLTLGLQYAGNVAAQSGITFEELTAALGSMANSGIRSGSTLGTGFRQVLISLQKPSGEFAKTLERLGLTMSDVDLKSKGLYGVLKTLKDAGFTAADAINSFEVRAAAAFNALENNLGMLQDLETDFQSSNAAALANETQMRSLENQYKRFQSTLGTVVSKGMEPILYFTRDLLSFLSDVLSATKNWDGALRVLTTSALALGAAFATWKIGSLVNGLLLAIPAVQGFAAASSFAAAIFSPWAVAITAVTVGLGFLVGSTISFTNEQGRLTTEIEKSRAALEQSKAAVEEYRSQITVVDGKIAELQNRYNMLSSDQQMLEREINAVRLQFADMGYSVTTVTSTVDGLIANLRNLRAQLSRAFIIKIGIQMADIDGSLAMLSTNMNIGVQKLIGDPNFAKLDPALQESFRSGSYGEAEIAAAQSAFNQMKAPATQTQFDAKNRAGTWWQRMSAYIAAGQSPTMAPYASDMMQGSIDARAAGQEIAGLDNTLTTLTDLRMSATTKAELEAMRRQTEADKAIVDARNTPFYQAAEERIVQLQRRAQEQAAAVEEIKSSQPNARLDSFDANVRPMVATVQAERALIEQQIADGTLSQEAAAPLFTKLAEVESSITGKRSEYFEAGTPLRLDAIQAEEEAYAKTYEEARNRIRKAENAADAEQAYRDADAALVQRYNQKRLELIAGVENFDPNNVDPALQAEMNSQTRALAAERERLRVDRDAKIEDINSPKGGSGGTGAAGRDFNLLMDELKSGMTDVQDNLKYGDISAPDAAAQMDQILAKAKEELAVRQQAMQGLNEKSAEYNRLKNEEKTLLNFIREQESQVRQLKEEQGLIQVNLNQLLQDYVNQNLNMVNTFKSGITNVLSTMQNAFAQLFTDLANGTKTGKEAFKDFARSVVGALQQMIAKMIAVYMMQKLIGMVNGAFGLDIEMPTFSLMTGGMVRKVRGGEVLGNLARDSKPHLLMPGEYVLRKSAVDMIGVDELNRINSMGNRAMATGGHVGVANQKRGPFGQTNVYVVSPDQQPVPGPADIIAVINDDIARGGSTKKLIKSVSMGMM